jgi:hypothetical protein
LLARFAKNLIPIFWKPLSLEKKKKFAPIASAQLLKIILLDFLLIIHWKMKAH